MKPAVIVIGPRIRVKVPDTSGSSRDENTCIPPDNPENRNFTTVGGRPYPLFCQFASDPSIEGLRLNIRPRNRQVHSTSRPVTDRPLSNRSQEGPPDSASLVRMEDMQVVDETPPVDHPTASLEIGADESDSVSIHFSYQDYLVGIGAFEPLLPELPPLLRHLLLQILRPHGVRVGATPAFSVKVRNGECIGGCGVPDPRRVIHEDRGAFFCVTL